MKGHNHFSVTPFIGFILKLAGLYGLFFFCCRLVFCYINVPAGNHEAFADYRTAFFMGLRFDLIICSYCLMLPALALFIHQLYLRNRNGLLRGVKLYIWIVTALLFFISCADIPYFSQFGSHISKSVFAWRLTPIYTLQLIFSNFFYWGFSLVFLFFFLLFLSAFKKITNAYLRGLAARPTPAAPKMYVNLILLFCVFVVLARGRISSKSPMHEGMAIVSQNSFVNQLALNPNFTLIKSLSRKRDCSREYLKNIREDLAISSDFLPNNFFPQKGVFSSSAQPFSRGPIHKLNVVVVLMESMTIAKMGYYNNKNLSPYLTELAKESVFFDRFFSSGIHTFNGLFSSTTGFPTIYTEQGLRQYTKKPFITLATLLKPYAYHSYFCATHDPVFDNMEGFFTLNGFDHILSSNNFKSSESLGVTGIPDHVLYHRLIREINANETNLPFVAYVMTGTDHGPWDIPAGIDFRPSGADSKENASLYADWAVKKFMEEAKKQSWYENTVFVFLGDHGQIMNDVYDMPITYHHIPLIIHCPKLLGPAVNHNLGYQPDLVKTLSSLLDVQYPNFSFGVNIFKEQRPFVFFSADDKLGYVTSDDFFFYHLLSSNQKKLVKYRQLDTKDYYAANKQHADSLYKLTRSLYHSAQYYIHTNYLNF